MNDLKKFIGRANIVERYEGVYAFPARLRNQPLFLEDRVTVWVQDAYPPDLLERMAQEAEPSTDIGIVEEYRHPRKGFHEDTQFRKLIASSSSQLQPLDRHDTSMECEKLPSNKGYDTDNRSQRSDFSRKESAEEVQLPLEAIGGNSPAMQIQSPVQVQQPVLQLERVSTPPKNRPQRYPVRSSARKQTKERAERIAQLKSVGCNCKKSHCLKMYCECFHLQVFCGDSCSCKGCGNMQRSTEQQQAIIQALSRNPRAFDEDNPEKGCFQLGVDLQDVKKGCKCKKTKCLKKYCECFNTGIACSVFCKCDGCQNHQ